jgi:hypothetical protein
MKQIVLTPLDRFTTYGSSLIKSYENEIKCQGKLYTSASSQVKPLFDLTLSLIQGLRTPSQPVLCSTQIMSLFQYFTVHSELSVFVLPMCSAVG